MKSIRYLKPLVSERVLRTPWRFLAEGAAESVSSRRSTTTGSAATSFGPADSTAVPRVRSAGTPALANGPSFWVALLSQGAATAASSASGVPWSAKPRRSFIVERTWRRVSGNFSSWASRSSPRSAVAWPAIGGVGEEAGDVLAVLGEGLEHGVAVAGEAVELVVLVGEDLEDAVGLAQGRVGAVDDGAEVVAAGGEAGAEVVEDEAEAVAVGGAVDVLDQVEVDGLAVVLERQQALALPGPVLDLLELGRRLLAGGAGLGRGAVDELLADQRLRADDAGGVLAEVLEGVVGDVQDDDGLAGDGVGAALEAGDLVVVR